jgi:hypothetical protein
METPLNNNIINELSKYYSELNNLELVNLNLLDETFNNYYWYICKKTGKLYHLNLYNLNNNINPSILSEINHNIFINVIFKIKEISRIIRNSIYSFSINDENNIKYYIVKDIYEDERTIINPNNSSRIARYNRRNILLENRKREYSEINEISEINENIEPNIKRKNETKDDIWMNMVSASSVRNYMLNDPLLDYLQEYNIYSINDNPSKTSNYIKKNNINIDTFTKYIMDAGVEFEEELIKIIKKNHKIVKVADTFQARNINKFNETIELMKQGEPIIYQGVLHDYETKIYGLPDLLVRSDYINKLLNYKVIDENEEKLGSELLNIPYHYKIIDIKHSNIQLKSNGIHILNSGSIPAYKGQLYIYTSILNKIQGININKAYIWGKRYNWIKKGIKYEEIKFLNKLGVIDYDNSDNEYINKTKQAIEWIKIVRNEGSNWSLLPIPSRTELFPNMKNEKDGHWRRLKNELNEHIHEITSVVYCGIEKRKKAHLNNVFEWNNPNCTSKIMGLNPNNKQSKIIDAVLDINRQNIDIIRPKYINYDRQNWKYINNDTFEFFIDFETFNSNFGSIIKNGNIIYDNKQFIFMIGLGYNINNEWNFKNFIMNEKNEESEYNILLEFCNYVNNLLKKYNKNKAKFYHWSHIEKSMFKEKNKIYQFNDSNYIFYDLYNVFISEPVVINGSLNYSLKSIIAAFNKHSLIDIKWDKSSPCSNGLSAMILANKIYEKHDKKIIDNVKTDNIMNEISQYNEIDCKVLYEILNYIRNNL